METILAYLEPMVKALTVGFLIYLPFLANRYLEKAQKDLKRR
jgi:hypothetical protein